MWKLSLSHDNTKQAQEVMIFSRKDTKKIHPKTFFNNIPQGKAESLTLWFRNN